MAFDATSPYALACLGDSVKSSQSLRVLGQEQPAPQREKDLIALAASWNVIMTENEAHNVVAEYDAVIMAQPTARHTLGAAMHSASAGSGSGS